MSRPRLIALLLALVTLVVYLPVTRHDFLHYDDDDYVVNNRVVQNGLTLAGVKWTFTTFHASNWHPVTWLSHMTDCQFFNLNAGAHHFINVLFHSASTALLFLLLWRLTEQVWPSALAAALFAWHPLHVESVAWVAERKDVLSTFFALLALLSYAKFVKEKCRRSYWFALFFFTLGLLSKPMLVTLPCVMLLLDFWPLDRVRNSEFGIRNVKALGLEKMPFFLLSAASSVVTCLAQRAAEVPLQQLPFQFRMENAVVAVARYFLKICWPANLAIVYPFATPPATAVALAAAVLLAVSAVAWRARNRRPYWIVGWLWFLGTLVPVIGLVQVGSTAMADRYTYIPSIGIFIAAAFSLRELAGPSAWTRKLVPAAATVLLVVCVALTERQLGCWRNSETLFRHALAVTANNDIAHDELGWTLELEGRPAGALAEYREALRLNPTRHQLHFSIGNMLEKLGHPAEALEEYRQCLRLDPKVPALHCAAGDALAALGKFAEALPEFAEAERLDAGYAMPHIGTAKVLFAQGQDTRAVAELWDAARIEPYNYTVLSTVARYLAANQNTAARDGQDALALALEANDLANNRRPEVLDVLGMAFAETGDFTNAVACVESALELAEAEKMSDTGPFQQRLELYKNHQPWRESFAGAAAVNW